MANQTISMSKIRHLLQLHSQGRSKLLISEQTGIARNTVKKYIRVFCDSGLSYEEISELSDKDLEDLFIHPEEKPVSDKLQTLFSLFPAIDKELRKKGITRKILWEHKMYVDFAGDKLQIIDPESGEVSREKIIKEGDSLVDRPDTPRSS